MDDFKPGQVISPQSASPNQPPIPSTGAPNPTRQPESPQPPAPTPSLEPPEPLAAPVHQANWQYIGPVADVSTYAAAEPTERFDPVDASPPQTITWTASEFVAHEKSQGWYARLAAVSLVLVVVIYFLTKDKITTGVIVFAAICMGVFAARKPHTQEYGLNLHGVVVGRKVYGFQDFKSFSVTEDGAIISVVFMPLKRFMPALTIYVAPEMENAVLDFLSNTLPFEQHHQDAVDTLMKRIRF